jgi:hypothetical protein
MDSFQPDMHPVTGFQRSMHQVMCGGLAARHVPVVHVPGKLVKLKAHYVAELLAQQCKSGKEHACLATRVLQAQFMRTVLRKEIQYLTTVLVKYPTCNLS